MHRHAHKYKGRKFQLLFFKSLYILKEQTLNEFSLTEGFNFNLFEMNTIRQYSLFGTNWEIQTFTSSSVSWENFVKN